MPADKLVDEVPGTREASPYDEGRERHEDAHSLQNYRRENAECNGCTCDDEIDVRG